MTIPNRDCVREILKQAQESLDANDVEGFYVTVYSVKLLAARDDRFRAWIHWEPNQATRSMMQDFCAHAERMIRQEEDQ